MAARRYGPARVLAAFALLCTLVMARRSDAVMDIEDRGPVLRAGRFTMRVSNVGVLGNPWFANGRSFDPSFEFPSGSGHELLGHAELWVGALNEAGQRCVSGGPMLEWRPTLDANDRVRRVIAGEPGGRWNVDDDGDGRLDEETVNGLDDDGDGRVDEDYDLPSQELLTAEYVDDRPEAVQYVYEGGELHRPLGLSVHQENFAWNRPGLDGIACVRFVITNHGQQTLTDLRLGLYADLDARGRNETEGHLDDRVLRVPFQQVTPVRNVVVNAGGIFRKTCFEVIRGEALVIADAASPAGFPYGALVPLSHTADPLKAFTNDVFPGVMQARAQARAPIADTTFHAYVFSPSLPPGQGGPPVLDRDRWEALEGRYPTASEDRRQDYSVLLSCGPFERLAPGQSVEFSVALMGAAELDSIPPMALVARRLERGQRYNLSRDDPGNSWFQGESGMNGHEICYEPPLDVSFYYDPHCPQKFFRDPYLVPDNLFVQGPSVAFEVPYAHGRCVWTDLDCDACTGNDGTDRAHRWSLLSQLPPPPNLRVSATDRRALIEWDDFPEVAMQAGLVGDAAIRLVGYKLYRLDDWARDGLLPAPDKWQRIAVFDQANIAAITSPDAAIVRDVNGVRQHAVGRYSFVDSTVHNGFDYSYVVTSVVRLHAPYDTLPGYQAELESSFEPDFDQRVVPKSAAREGPGRVWVAPNPYRGGAAWERPAVPGDVFTQHVDFFGLPARRCTIRIYTLAGDLVAEVPHDGTGGVGQASWNLISRNGQDVASGVYLFTVEGSGDRTVGRFVIMR